jgi:hypothetical protein
LLSIIPCSTVFKQLYNRIFTFLSIFGTVYGGFDE